MPVLWVKSEAYSEVRKEKPPTLEADEPVADPEVQIPDELQCRLCCGLLRDAVFLSCCVEACCDDCIRSSLIESDEHQCPLCGVKGVSPDTLIPCIKLRKEVMQFVNLSNPLWPRDNPAPTQLPDPVIDQPEPVHEDKSKVTTNLPDGVSSSQNTDPGQSDDHKDEQ